MAVNELIVEASFTSNILNEDERLPGIPTDEQVEAATDNWLSKNFGTAIAGEADEWLEENIIQETGYALDRSLMLRNAAAPADLVGEIREKFPVGVFSTDFFENINYGAPDNVEFTHIWPDTNGLIHSGNNSTNSLIINNVRPNTKYNFRIPGRNRMVCVGTPDGSFTVGETYSVYTVESITSDSTYNEAYFTTGANTGKLLLYFYSGTFDYEQNKNDIIITEGELNTRGPSIKGNYIVQPFNSVAPYQTRFFSNENYFDSRFCTFASNVFFGANGLVSSASNSYTVTIPVEPSTKYTLYIPNANRCQICELNTNVLAAGHTHTVIFSVNSGNWPCTFTTGATAKYIGVYFNSGAYDINANIGKMILNKGETIGIEKLQSKYIASQIDGAKVLIFGDSITDCCNITINSSNQTTAYAWKNPSNSYVNAESQTVNYSMWPKILKENQPCGEIRNYAFSGASYKTENRASGNERQNVQYQITVAINDIDNPNNVFKENHYTPDVVVFALGTNDGNPNDTFDSAMAATVTDSAGTIDVNATLSALDDTKTIASARKAFMRVKQVFPMAQIYCVLPLQRAGDDTNFGNLRTYLTQMAQRYGVIIIDGTAESGITRDFNVSGGLGEYLKDGLHPNEKGQNLMARMIISSLNSHYIPFGSGFNA